MQDQVAVLVRRGIPAGYLSSVLDAADRTKSLNDLYAGRTRLLYCAPERLESLVPELRARHLKPALLAIDGPCAYFERRNWDFPALARALGASAERVTTAAELSEALHRAEACAGAYLIEAVTARDDLSPVMARIRAQAQQARA